MKGLKKYLPVIGQKLDRITQYDGISNKQANYILLFILLLTSALRLSMIQAPPIDRAGWKEIDHIMISQNFQEHGYNFLQPEVSWPAEEPRVTAMELPVVPYLASLLYPVWGVNAFSVRLITQLSFLLLIVYLYKLTKRETGIVLALVAAGFAAALPLFNPFRNTLFSEPLMIFLSVFSIFHYARWIDLRKILDLIVFIFAFSIAISLKPTALYLLLPFLWIHFRKHRFQFRNYWSLILSLSIAMILPLLWYIHAFHISQTSIDVFGVFGGKFGGHDKFQTFAMLTDIHYYYTMYMRLKMLLLGNFGLIFMAIGVLAALYYKKGLLFIAYLFAIVSFFVIVAEGNIDTIYRQLTIIPAASFLLALGTVTICIFLSEIAKDLLGEKRQKFVLPLSIFICVSLLAILPVNKRDLFFSIDKTTPAHKTDWLFAQEIKKVATENSKMIVAGGYTIHKGGNDLSPVLYYYSGIQGWSIQEGEWNEEVINELKNKGADLLAVADYKREARLEKFVETLKAKYEVLYSNPDEQLLLISLNPG